MLSFLLIRVGDAYPKKYRCMGKFPCTVFKKKGLCNSKWSQVGLPKWCLNTLNEWEKNQKIRAYHCRRTCRTCRPGQQKSDLGKGKFGIYLGKIY